MPGLVEKSPLKGTQSSRVHPAVSRSPGIDARAGAPSTETFGSFDEAHAAAVRDWHERLDRVEIRLPPAADPLVKTFKTVLAHILINRDGPAIQPGSRSYARTWIRDGSLTSSALLRAAHPEPVRQLIEWFAPYQFANGKIPCCVDARGADPVPENDSHGEFLYLVSEYWRYTKDRGTVEKVWPHVEKAVAYIDELRKQRRTDEYRPAGQAQVFWSPPRIDQPRGLFGQARPLLLGRFLRLDGIEGCDRPRPGSRKDGAGETLGRHPRRIPDRSLRFDQPRHLRGQDRLHPRLRRSSGPRSHLHDHGDHPWRRDRNLRNKLPRPTLERTFEYYWQEIEKRKAGDWKAYTPYETRAVGTFIRLGWIERAHDLLGLFMDDRRPAGWNQWPEVVFKDQRAPSFLGDLPHTWVGSDFMRSFLDLFAYERESDRALVLAAGVPREWIAAPGGVAVRRLPTPWGLLEYSLTAEGDGVRLRVGPGITVPPGGIVFGGTVIRKLPADLVVSP